MYFRTALAFAAVPSNEDARSTPTTALGLWATTLSLTTQHSFRILISATPGAAAALQ
jgi:hypothetical protein